MIDRQDNRRIYFDANAFIYAIEGVDEIAVLLHSLLAALQRQAERACTSGFTLACNTFVSFDRGLRLPVGLERIGSEEGRLLQLVQGMP